MAERNRLLARDRLHCFVRRADDLRERPGQETDRKQRAVYSEPGDGIRARMEKLRHTFPVNGTGESLPNVYSFPPICAFMRYQLRASARKEAVYTPKRRHAV